MRPAETYRGARRNKWHDKVHFERLDGHSWKVPFDDKLIKYRPRVNRGWDYRNGGRAQLNKVMDLWRNVRRRIRGGYFRNG